MINRIFQQLLSAFYRFSYAFSYYRRFIKNILYGILCAVIFSCRTYLCQIQSERTGIFGDRHLVIIQHHYQITTAFSGIVKAFVSLSAG